MLATVCTPPISQMCGTARGADREDRRRNQALAQVCAVCSPRALPPAPPPNQTSARHIIHEISDVYQLIDINVSFQSSLSPVPSMQQLAKLIPSRTPRAFSATSAIHAFEV